MVFQLLLVGVLIFSMVRPVFARQVFGGDAQSRVIFKTIIIDDYVPYTFINSAGKPDGFSVDLMDGNQGMDIVKATDKYKEIYPKWFGSLESNGISTETFLKYLGIILLIFLAAGGLLLVWSFSLRRQVAVRTKALELEMQERRNAESALRESETSFQKIFDKSASGYVLASPQGRLIKVNAALAEMLGYSIDELQQIHFSDITHADDLEISRKSLEVLLSGEREVFQLEKRYIHRDGRPIWAFVNVTLVRDVGNLPVYFITSIFDISARRKVEDALRESEYFFKESQRAAFIGSYKANFGADHWDSSELLDQIFGIDQSYDRSIKGLLGLIHPEDVDMMTRYLTEEVIMKGRPFNRDYRIIRRSDGEVRWVHGAGEADFDKDGNILSLIGTIQDIHERKLAQDAVLEKAEVLERFNTLMVNRELRMIELKHEINDLCARLGQPPRYVLEFDDTAAEDRMMGENE